MSVKRHLNLEQLERMISAERSRIRALRKMAFIRDLYLGYSVKIACRRNYITVSCGYLWLKQWNALGPLAFVRSRKIGRPRKVPVSKQLIELIKNSRSLKMARESIKERYGIEYSYRQILRISKKLEEERFLRNDL